MFLRRRINSYLKVILIRSWVGRRLWLCSSIRVNWCVLMLVIAGPYCARSLKIAISIIKWHMKPLVLTKSKSNLFRTWRIVKSTARLLLIETLPRNWTNSPIKSWKSTLAKVIDWKSTRGKYLNYQTIKNPIDWIKNKESSKTVGGSSVIKHKKVKKSDHWGCGWRIFKCQA